MQKGKDTKSSLHHSSIFSSSSSGIVIVVIVVVSVLVLDALLGVNAVLAACSGKAF